MTIEQSTRTGVVAVEFVSREVGACRRWLVHGSLVLLVIVLLKWLCLEVFFIPSPSMQPLLLGCREAGVHDRVLVDKLRYLLTDPQRWNVVAFRSPLQRRQAVVKRCVGMPGERLRIAGGNVHLLDGPADAATLRVLRKPDSIQRGLWREIYPARRLLRGQATALGGGIAVTPASAWTELPGGELVARGGSEIEHLLVLDDEDGGLVDRIWDGYPPRVAGVLREISSQWGLLGEIVPDARVAVEVQTAAPPTAFDLNLTVRRPGRELLRFALELRNETARLVVRGGHAFDEVAASAPFPCSLGDQGSARITFAHLDDELIAWRNDEVIGRLDTSEWHCRGGCELPSPRGTEPFRPTADQCVELSLRFRAAEAVMLADLRVWRDLHYTRGAQKADQVIEVPDGHYFVLGDNPQQSQDSRGWPTIELGRGSDGSLVPPTAAGAVRHRGALRLGDSERPPRAEENPVFVPGHGAALLLDEFGEPRRFSLSGPVSWHFGILRIGEGAAAWEPPTSEMHFVERSLLIGRVVARIWPLPPLGPWRPGWVR